MNDQERRVVAYYSPAGEKSPYGVACELRRVYSYLAALPTPLQDWRSRRDRQEALVHVECAIRVLNRYHDSKPHCEWDVEPIDLEADIARLTPEGPR